MKIAPVADVKARLSRYLKDRRRSPVIVTRNGRPAALLVCIPEDEEELERFLLAHAPAFRHLLEAAMTRVRRKGGLHHGDFWRSVNARSN